MVLVLAATVMAEQQNICSPLHSVDMQLFLEAQAAVCFLDPTKILWTKLPNTL